MDILVFAISLILVISALFMGFYLQARFFTSLTTTITNTIAHALTDSIQVTVKSVSREIYGDRDDVKQAEPTPNEQLVSQDWYLQEDESTLDPTDPYVSDEDWARNAVASVRPGEGASAAGVGAPNISAETADVNGPSGY